VQPEELSKEDLRFTMYRLELVNRMPDGPKKAAHLDAIAERLLRHGIVVWRAVPETVEIPTVAA
jgi:hypothetical protein